MKAVVFLLALLILPPVQADWLMYGKDAQGTRSDAGSGISWPDVALRVDIGSNGTGGARGFSNAVVTDGAVWIAEMEGYAANAVKRWLWKVSLDGTSPSIVASWPETLVPSLVTAAAPALVAHRGVLYIVAGSSLLVYDIMNGTRDEFSYLEPRVDSPTGTGSSFLGAGRARIVAENGLLYIANSDPLGTPPGLTLFVVDPVSRTNRGTWVFPAPWDLYGYVPGAVAPAGTAFNVVGLAVEDGVAAVTANRIANTDDAGTDPPTAGTRLVWGVDTAIAFPSVPMTEPLPEARAGTWSRGDIFPEVSPPVLKDGEVIVNMEFPFVVNATTGNESRGNEAILGHTGVPLALAGDRLFVAAHDVVYALGTDLVPLWDQPARLPGVTFSSGSLAVLGDQLLALGGAPGAPSVLVALDSASGAVQWEYRLQAQSQMVATEGIAVTWDAYGIVNVFGELPISLRADAAPSTLYPALGAEVRVDLGGTDPSPLGNVTKFSAEWGDGGRTEWQADPVLRHVYATSHEATARFFVRNDAGQTSSTTVVFHVGTYDPDQTFLNDPLAERYEEQLYFTFGLLVTGLAALFGFFRIGRKRRLLDRELRELEAEYKATRHEPDSCERMLAERRARTRSLFLEKRLEEAHSSFLEKRIDELQRGLRAGAVDEQLRFLSHGLVLRLKRLLADARVDAVERADFLDALERERLPAKERDKVRSLLESWFMRDEEART